MQQNFLFKFSNTFILYTIVFICIIYLKTGLSILTIRNCNLYELRKYKVQNSYQKRKLYCTYRICIRQCRSLTWRYKSAEGLSKRKIFSKAMPCDIFSWFSLYNRIDTFRKRSLKLFVCKLILIYFSWNKILNKFFR